MEIPEELVLCISVSVSIEKGRIPLKNTTTTSNNKKATHKQKSQTNKKKKKEKAKQSQPNQRWQLGFI